MKRHSLRNRIVLLMIVVLVLPTMISGYLMTISAETALIEEKQRKLFGAAKILETLLEGTFEDILRQYDSLDSDKQEKTRIINKVLQPMTDLIAEAYPGIGVGYYVKDLDIQATYGPSKIYAGQVGLSIGPDHEGRIVMKEGRARVQVGTLMRGNIMNAMYPIVRQGQVIGYVYSNELTADIDAQLGSMKRQMYIILIVGLFVGVSGVYFLVNRMTQDIKQITDGLADLKLDFRHEIPQMSGEMGIIAAAINEMGKELRIVKHLEEQLQQAERMSLLGAIAAGLAHDIRNPLMAIRGFAQLLSEACVRPEQAEYVEIIIKETVRMDGLINQLLRFSRKPRTDNTLIDVKDVMESTFRLINTKPMLGLIDFRHETEMALPKVIANEEELHQVLLNILINAIQAVGSMDGHIIMSAIHDRQREAVVISVKDDGPGISRENLDKLFTPFYTTKSHGTGLGLSIANRIVKSWGGEIAVVSMKEGGTEFMVILPAVQGETEIDAE